MNSVFFALNFYQGINISLTYVLHIGFTLAL
ncbi:hypothetical protein DFP75_101926 [Marinomonas alcarazii]|uniref:Uncharacterized protein n=1 Tax=Marinomonas alcarazii TaxID=491949 RepID=A0A318V8G6_9GAMM|nr:hypothetical protein DFP75_101926 [Marinomonas alcarazii]